jgi:hypothetical protein
MKKLLVLFCLICTNIQSLEYEIQFENDLISISRVLVEPKEEIGLHRDALPQVIIGLKGGTITRLEADGREVDVEFPTGKAVFRSVDPEGVLHRSINKSDNPIEIMIVQMKKIN